MTIDMSNLYTLDNANIAIDDFAHDEYDVSESQSVEWGERLDRFFNANLNFKETVSYSESKKINTTVFSKESPIYISQSESKNINKLIFGTQINRATMRSQSFFDRFITEKAKALEAPFKSIYKPFSEDAISKDGEKWFFTKKSKDSLINNDLVDRVWDFKKTLYETAKLSDRKKLNITIHVKENLMGKDLRLAQTAECVLSDISLSHNGMTESEFEKAINKPSGYSQFHEYKVGTYNYQDAIYRLVIRKKSLAANPLVYDYKIHVDIDDVKDRGTLSIPAEETKVYFHRTYYTTPDVVVNVVGGAGDGIVIPTITETDGEDDNGRYFKVILKGASGKAVAGIITWNSTGY
ncbi:hypothetical protein [uncultured Dialister sp.]|uniref:hypothetical protein n=1 Tax=Dialister succinatiphilus TaxID=487173 RepID=UPI00267022A2|nr:hypothetical protein [uncultured Dialister sp.]